MRPIFQRMKKQKYHIRLKFFKKLTKDNIPNDLDVIVITAPTYLHTVLANIAIKKVRIVIIEKPLGIEIKRAERLINYANKKKKGDCS